MFITRLRLHNWRNFRDIDVPLQRRVFIVGANATGKSNLLDAVRFLRDIAKESGGGLQAALASRGGFQQARSLFARGKDNHILIDAELSADPWVDKGPAWRYRIELRQETWGTHRVLVEREQAWHEGRLVLDRPDRDDAGDDHRLTQTALEQINANKPFRPVAEFLASVRYLHLVPQMVRHAQEMQARALPDDPFGQGFLEQLMRTPKRTRDARLRRIEKALRSVIPQFSELRVRRDEVSGRPHLEARFEHWRARGAWQRDDSLSDGTLRLIALLWAAYEPGGPLLLEEPELSLHDAIVRHLPGAFGAVALGLRSAGVRTPRQIWLTTHSAPLLSDEGISLSEVVLLYQEEAGTRATTAAHDPALRALREAGQPIGDAVLPWVGVTSPQLTFLR